MSNSTTESNKPSATLPPGEEQFKKLVEIISRSQHNYRELIDSLDQAVFTISLEGEIRVANRSFAEILGEDFHTLIGHRIHEFIAAPSPKRQKSGWLDFSTQGWITAGFHCA